MASLQKGSQSSESQKASRKPEEQKKHKQKGKSPKLLKVMVNHPKGLARTEGCKCTECEKSFKEKSALLKHLTSHTQGRPYKCTTCGKDFSKRSSLVIHQQTHAARTLFACNECGKTFARKSNLLVHHKTHLQKKADHSKSIRNVLKCTKQGKMLKERPYKCPDCKKIFVLHKNFVKHQKSHVQITPLSPEPAPLLAHPIEAPLSRVEKPAVDRSEMILEELTRMRENVDMLLLNQQCQLQVLQEIQRQLGFLLPGNDLINANVYSLGLLLGQQAVAVGSPFPLLFNPSNLLPESARPFSSRISS